MRPAGYHICNNAGTGHLLPLIRSEAKRDSVVFYSWHDSAGAVCEYDIVRAEAVLLRYPSRITILAAVVEEWNTVYFAAEAPRKKLQASAQIAWNFIREMER